MYQHQLTLFTTNEILFNVNLSFVPFQDEQSLQTDTDKLVLIKVQLVREICVDPIQ